MARIKLETDREPDFTLKIWFTPRGYEAKAYTSDGLLFSRGRDTGDAVPSVKRMIQKLHNDSWWWLEYLYVGLEIEDVNT